MFRLSRFFLILFILTSFITQSMGESNILSRITLPDIFGAISVILFLFSGIKINFIRFWYVILFISVLFVGGIFGLEPMQSIIEVVILFFLFLVFLLMVAQFGSMDGVKKLVYYFAWAGLLASVIGIYDYAASMVGLPRLFPGRATGELVSGFRNAGQAGAYALIALSILIPVRSSKMFDLFNWKQKRIITYSVVLTLLFLFLTGKIAAYIGFAIGLSGFFLMQRNFRSFFMTIIAGSIFLYLFANLESIAPEVANRITQKYNTRLGGELTGESSYFDEDQFMGRNISESMEAFNDSPLLGTGIGGFNGNYGRHEIHSTYFKMLGEAGLLGVIVYFILMYKFLGNFRFRSRKEPLQEFLYYVTPFIFGCLVSWAYTYHVRKREFWIMFAVIVIVNQLIIFDKKYKSVEKNTN